MATIAPTSKPSIIEWRNILKTKKKPRPPPPPKPSHLAQAKQIASPSRADSNTPGILSPPSYQHLTRAQVDSFMRFGYLRLESCFTAAQASAWTSTIWTRLGFSATDQSTWTRECTHMPSHTTVAVSTFAPKAWAAICELCGGEDRVMIWSDTWRDAFIVNVGSKNNEGKITHPKDLKGWHVDGDFFTHFLDSPEQGLLVIPLFSDIVENGGGTVVCPDGLGEIARHLYEHPEGVSPRMASMNDSAANEGAGFYNNLVQSCTEFHEMTGKTGDVILLHPLMVHSASKNGLRIPRFITNPPVALRAPFNFDRADPSEYSLVELKTLQEVGADCLKGWKISGARQKIVPDRLRIQEQMKKDEMNRLQANEAGNSLQNTVTA